MAFVFESQAKLFVDKSLKIKLIIKNTVATFDPW
jgi:hypothetical protein